VSGSGVAGYTVQIYDNGVAIAGTGLRWVGNTWSLTISLAPGQHVLTASETRVAGVTSDQGNSFSVTVVVPPPPAPSITGPANVIAGTVFTLTGRGVAGNTIRLYDGGVAIAGLPAITVDASGNWSVSLSLSVAGSTHSLTATQTSPTSGFTSAASVGATIKAWAPPAAPVITGSSRFLSYVTLSGTGIAGQQMTIYDAGVAVGSATVGASGTWSFTGRFASGAHSFTSTQTLYGVASGSSNVLLVTVP
jgi:hypothetical protein